MVGPRWEFPAQEIFTPSFSRSNRSLCNGGKRVFYLLTGNLRLTFAGETIPWTWADFLPYSPAATGHLPGTCSSKEASVLSPVLAPIFPRSTWQRAVKILGEKVSHFRVLGPNYSKVVFTWLLQSLSFQENWCFCWVFLTVSNSLCRFFHPKWKQK